MVTIQDVAKHAGVSVATVSHVLNKTRYVSPKLEEKVELSIRELGYEPIRKNAGRILKNQIVGVIIPDLSVDFYAVFANEITYLLEKHEFKVVLLDSCGDSGRETENLMSLNWQSNVIAVIVIPLSKILPWNGTKLKKKCLIVGEIPEKQKFHIVLPEYENASFKAVQQLILSGHESIALLLQDKTDRTSSAEYYSGYKSAHRHYRINPKENSIYYETDLKTEKVKDLFCGYTAVICATDRITMRLFQELERAEMTCPEDMSVISLEWNQRSGVYQPALTVIGVDPKKMAEATSELFLKCDALQMTNQRLVRVSNKAVSSASVRIIGRGPYGEKIVSCENLYLTEEEIKKVRSGNYKGVLLFQFSGKRWMRLIDQAVRTVFEKLNIQLLEMFDADSNNQVFIEKVWEWMEKKPDFILCAPANDKSTEGLYNEIARSGIRLFFIGRVPQGMRRDGYECCVVSNEQKSGYNCAKLLDDYFNKKPAKIALLTCSSSYISGRDRDIATKKVLQEQFPHLHIVAHERFTLRNYAYGACMKMIKEYPDIQGIYVTWEDPAIQTISALMDAGREDIKIVTGDLDTEVAQDVANGHLIIGMSAQMPYDQGEELAYAVANVLLGKRVSKVIGVEPLLVTAANLEEAWYVMTKEKAPQSIVNSLTETRKKEKMRIEKNSKWKTK